MSNEAKAMREAPREPTEEMLIAARDWSDVLIVSPIGSRAAIGVWQAMFDAIPAEPRPDPVAAHREKIKAQSEHLQIAISFLTDKVRTYNEGKIDALEWALALMAEPGGDAAGGGA